MNWNAIVSAAIILLSLSACSDPDDHEGLRHIPNFGTNPGDLQLFLYEPPQPQGLAPLVLALHGCSQDAGEMAELTGWNTQAERYGFYVAYPQQRMGNNVTRCFNWFQEDDITRGKGEARSIKSMVDHLLANYPIDPGRVFITGLSAGGAMTSVAMACYPEVFAGGAVMGGGAYRAATNLWESTQALLGNVTKTQAEWGALARSQHPSFNGSYGRMAVIHGRDDLTVNHQNAVETTKQWCDLHGLDAGAAELSAEPGAPDVSRFSHGGSEGPVVRFSISDMGHAIPVHPGVCRHQGGQPSTFATDKSFYSTYHAAFFFGIIPRNIVSGPSQATEGQAATFSVPHHAGSVYTWSLPQGCMIVSAQNASTIQVTWGNEPGVVSASETAPNGCVYPHTGLMVAM